MKRAEKRVLAATVLFGALLIVAPLWWRAQNANIVVSIPEATLPNPNAFDDYARAAAQIRYDFEVNAAISIFHPELPLRALPISPPQDIKIEVSNGAFGPPSTTKRLPGPPPITNRVLHREYSIIEKEWLLKQNAAVLQSVAQGLRRRCLQPSQSYVLDGGPGPHFRSVFHLMTLRAQVQAQRGDLDGALQTLLDEVQVSIGLSQNAPVHENSVAWRGEQLAARELWELMPRLNARQTKQATQRLETLLARRPTYRQMLQQEKWCTQRGLLEAFQYPDWRLQIAWSTGNANPSLSQRAQVFALNAVSKRRVFDTYDRHMNNVIARATQPYRNAEIEIPISDPVSAHLLGFSLRSHWAHANRQAQTPLLLTALALHAHKLEQGAYPSTLNALVPRYLQAVPLDPFSNRQTLRYKLRPVRFIKSVVEARKQVLHNEYSIVPYTLYSVGGDAADNKGQPATNAFYSRSAEEKCSLYRLMFENKGDIVAGINTR
ncbi:MAG TPA: hypothetical protein VM821_00550 [Abditibacteriaceae bacterium]|nr:hypothetical protein [Abditibacteriaceae bacterium]